LDFEMRFVLRSSFSVVLSLSCSTDGNIANCETGQKAICSEQTSEEKARKAMAAGDYSTAITLLEELKKQELSEDAPNYGLFVLLAAAYAGRAEVDLFTFVTKLATGGGDVTGIRADLASPTADGQAVFDAKLADVEKGIATIKDIPGALRGGGSTEEYASSADLQLSIYSLISFNMKLNKIQLASDPSKLDIAQIQNLSDEEILDLVENLDDTAAGLATENPELKAKLDENSSEFKNDDGSIDQEKFKEFLSKQNES
jgi:hypothetical protein